MRRSTCRTGCLFLIITSQLNIQNIQYLYYFIALGQILLNQDRSKKDKTSLQIEQGTRQTFIHIEARKTNIGKSQIATMKILFLPYTRQTTVDRQTNMIEQTTNDVATIRESSLKFIIFFTK